MKQSGFSLLETLLALGLFMIVVTMFVPWWTNWQSWLARSLAQSTTAWESDFIAHRIYYKSLQNRASQSNTQLLFTGADGNLLYLGFKDNRIYEESGNRRYLTYAPLQADEWSVQSVSGQVHVLATLSEYNQQQTIDIYVP